MSTIAFDTFALTRIADFARSLSRLHQASRRQAVDDDAIDREFNAVCLSVWGYTTDDFSDDLFSDADHAFLNSLDEAHARIFAAEQGYDLVDDEGMLTDWWGYCWMILAEKRGLLTPEESRRGAGANRGKISLGAERDRRHRRAVRTLDQFPSWRDRFCRHSGMRAKQQTSDGNAHRRIAGFRGSMLSHRPE